MWVVEEEEEVSGSACKLNASGVAANLTLISLTSTVCLLCDVLAILNFFLET